MDSGIYKILNKTNNKVYIGSSITLKNREYKHFWMLRNCNHDNKFLQNSFNLIGISDNKVSVFDNLFEAARYLIDGGFTNGSERNVRQKISQALRGKKINNGYNGSIRKTIYKHHFETINY